MSKKRCNEDCRPLQGQKDACLSGKNEPDPSTGMDPGQGNRAPAVRKRGVKKGILILILSLSVSAVVGLLLGYWVCNALFSEPDPKTFTSDGVSITLNDQFERGAMTGYTAVYEAPAITVFMLREPFSRMPGLQDYTLEQYGDLVIRNNDTSAALQSGDGLNWFEYEFFDVETTQTYHYFAYVYKTDDAFWLIQFATLPQNADTYREQIPDWAKSVEFVD